MQLSRRSTVSVKAASARTSKVQVSKPAAPKAKTNNLAVLAKLADLGVLSKVEELKVLSQLEKAGFSLSAIEEKGLLSFAEKSGALKLVADESTPGTLGALGFLLLVAAASAAFLAPQDVAVAADVSAALLGVTGIAAIVGGQVLEKVQKL